MIRQALITLVAFSALLQTPESIPLADVDSVVARDDGAAIEMDPRAMAGLEDRGLSLARLFGARRRTNDSLATTPLFGSLVATLDRDLAELDARPTIGEGNAPNHPFRSAWLRDPRAHFELVAAVHRLDRAFVEGPGSRSECGEARLIYRLVLAPEARPPTALPMTINVVFAQKGSGDGCRAAARAWLDLLKMGKPRVDAIASLYASLGPFIKVEANLQNLHGPALRPGEDDHAEYLLRSFERVDDALVPRPLLDTPRDDLDPDARRDLAIWIREHFAEIDEGDDVIPDRFLAMRSVSVAPRGAARARNRTFRRLFEAASFEGLPYERARLVRSPTALLRRLDQGTCSGCHETRAIAGFHVLGEDRNSEARFNALAVGASTHLARDLAWRSDRIASIAKSGRDPHAPRPFADHAREDDGAIGAHCTLGDDPTYASWTCADGLRCRDLYRDPDRLGVCVPADANHEGDACEDARAIAATGADGDRIEPSRKEGCLFDGVPQGPDACSPNHYGFPGGMCSDACTTLGVRHLGDPFVCADLPASGYESECFPTDVPIETCLLTHFARRRVRGCDAKRRCRDDYACARVPGLAPGEGACVPPYFVFQARVDGPRLDR